MIETVSTIWLALFIVLAIWEIVWKGIALWRSGRNNHLTWFVFIFLLNTLGILPIVYLVWFQNKATIKKSKKFKR